METLVTEAKAVYAETLHNLERISDEIHQKRREARHRRKRLLKQNGGNIIYHPLMNSSESSSDEEEIFIDLVPPGSEDAKGADCQVPADPLHVRERGFPAPRNPPQRSRSPVEGTGEELGSKRDDVISDAASNERPTRKDAESQPTVSLTTTPSSPRTPPGNSGGSPEADPDQIRCNAEIMASISRSKSSRPYLRPNRSHDDFLVDGSSETESVTSSFASAAMLDDEQIESLMLETTAYHDFLAKMDSNECDHFKRMSLPGKLGYLKNYVNFEPIWVDDEHDLTSKSTSDPDDLDSATGVDEDTDGGNMVKVQRRLLEQSGADVDDISISKTHYV